MNPRTVVIALLTMVTAVTGYTVLSNIGDLPLDASTTSVVSEEGR